MIVFFSPQSIDVRKSCGKSVLSGQEAALRILLTLTQTFVATKAINLSSFLKLAGEFDQLTSGMFVSVKTCREF